MNPSTQISPELPLPKTETAPLGSQEVVNTGPKPEVNSFSNEAMSQQGPMLTPQADQGQAAAAIADPAASLVPLTAVTTAPTNVGIADDVDVIEKEWVERAKRIVGSTREDPNLQTKELGKFKAEYIGKRFQKQIKLPEEGK